MNGDLISREALIKEIEHGKHPEFYDGQDIADWQMRCIENAPAVDAEPVKHGRWEDMCRGKVRVCSCCKHHFDNTCNDIDGEWIFCPTCGAKMYLEDEQ